MGELSAKPQMGLLHLHPSPEKPRRHPAQGQPREGKGALCHEGPQLLGKTTLPAHSGTSGQKKMALSRRLAVPWACAALSRQVPRPQMLWAARGQSPHRPQVPLPILSLQPMTLSPLRHPCWSLRPRGQQQTSLISASTSPHPVPIQSLRRRAHECPAHSL